MADKKNTDNIKTISGASTSEVVSGNTGFSKKVKDVFGVKIPKNNIQTEKQLDKVSEKKPEYEGQQTEKLYDLKNFGKNLTPKKIIKLAVLLILVVMVFLALYVKYIKKGPIRDIPLIDVPKPTVSNNYQKYKPSIYAEDSNFIKIDEGLSVLKNEVESITLEEKALLPPKLDFDISF